MVVDELCPRSYPTCSRRLELWVAASMVNSNSIGDFEGFGTAALAMDSTSS